MAIIVDIPKPRTLDMAEVFRGAPEPDCEVLCKMQGLSEMLEARSESFTIVMNRDIRGSVEMASEMAVHIAQKFQNKQVLLVNTYASTALMRRTLAHAMLTRGILLPPNYKDYFEPSYFARGVPAGFVEGVPDPNPQNLRVLDCPVSTCAPWRIKEDVALHHSDVIIINSFEFAALTVSQRQHLAEGLLDLYARTRCTIVIFSQEMRSDIAPYRKGRGPLGVISAHAASVWKIMTTFEEVQWSKRWRNIPRGYPDVARNAEV
ncbi:MAG: hypothetical protein Q8902_05675 [Bacteroidota bacterium]|nr:hypothetical protein [Bacteroidota bacterium]MDP4232802.1 hypothetical protein [Bacteroidota bacterium]MDP4242517.1 hypothetical protein [Bacteroidota bacterium]